MTEKEKDSKFASESKNSTELFCSQDDYKRLRDKAKHAAFSLPGKASAPGSSVESSTRVVPEKDCATSGSCKPPVAFENVNPVRKSPSKAGKGKVVGIVIGAAVVLSAAVYIGGAAVFMGRFYPNTTMGDLDLSMKTADEAASMLADAEKDYVLHVTGQGLDFDIASGDAGLVVDARSIMAEALESFNPWLWPFNIAGSHDAAGHVSVAADSTALDEAVRSAVESYNASVAPSEDAHVAFDANVGAYAVSKEVYGDQVSADIVLQHVAEAVSTMEKEVVLGEDVLIKPAVLSDDPRLASAAEKANVMAGCDVVLKDSMNGVVMAEIDGSDVSAWISFDENLDPVLDEAAMGDWAEKLASSFNTVGTERTYTRPDGKVVTAGGGDYGWAIDSAALVSSVKNAITEGVVGELSVPCSVTGNGYTAPGRDWGAFCDVDLTEQHAYYYDASGSLLWDSGIVSGKPGEDATPTGVFYLKNLQTNVSLKGPIDPETNKPEWDSPVDYWMPFVGNMVGLHDAPWQSSSVFGDSSAYKTYGSRGCVNLPSDKAGELFSLIKPGDPVIVHW